jgi:hypothetical protein
MFFLTGMKLCALLDTPLVTGIFDIDVYPDVYCQTFSIISADFKQTFSRLSVDFQTCNGLSADFLETFSRLLADFQQIFLRKITSRSPVWIPSGSFWYSGVDPDVDPDVEDSKILDEKFI